MNSITEKGLTLQDMILLMDAYKNNVELTTTLMERLSQILFQQDEILTKQKDTCSEIVNTTNAMREFSTAMVEKVAEINKDIIEVKLEMVKENSSLKNLMYVGIVGSIGLIGSIITLTVDLSSKYDLIQKIAVKLGISF